MPSVEAAGAKHGSDNQERVRQAVELAHPDANFDQLELSERADLSEELLRIADKTTLPVSFYSVHDIDSSSEDGSLWVVVSVDSALGSDELYSFESSDDVEHSSQKFNRLLSHLALYVPNYKATSIARFFLSCCVRGARGEIVTDEDDLRYSLERYYMRAYGDVPRALEAHAEWWQGYEASAVELRPTLVVEGGLQRVILERLIFRFGMHPQLQKWALAVSVDGTIGVLDVESIFPKQSRWLSYAFRSTTQPQIH